MISDWELITDGPVLRFLIGSGKVALLVRGTIADLEALAMAVTWFVEKGVHSNVTPPRLPPSSPTLESDARRALPVSVLRSPRTFLKEAELPWGAAMRTMKDRPATEHEMRLVHAVPRLRRMLQSE